MSDDKGKARLGRGLSALLGDDASDYAALDSVRESKSVPIEYLRPNRFQPRRTFDEAEITSLANSIAEQGILQPILVRRDAEHQNGYEIVAGERRWRAAQRARLHVVPVIIKELSDQKALEVALVENIQRADLNPLDEAEGYRRLMQEFHHTQDRLSEVVGKSRSHIANMLRLLSLPDEVKEMITGGLLTAGHARALINDFNPKYVAREAVKKGMSVRQVEAMVARRRENDERGAGGGAGARPPLELTKDADTAALERDLSNALGLKVEIKFRGAGGELVIHYGSVDQLDDVLQRLSKPGSEKH